MTALTLFPALLLLLGGISIWVSHSSVQAQHIKNWLGAAWNYVQIGVLGAALWFKRFVRNLAFYVIGYILLLQLVLLIELDWLSLVILTVGAVTTGITVAAVHLIRFPLAEASEKLDAWGKLVFESVPIVLTLPATWSARWKVAFSLLMAPINAVYLPISLLINTLGGIMVALGGIAMVAARLLNAMTIAVAGIQLGLLFLTSLAIVDLTTGTNLLDSWSSYLLTMIAITLVTLAILAVDFVGQRGQQQAAQPRQRKRPTALIALGSITVAIFVLCLLAYWNPGVAQGIGMNARNAQVGFERALDLSGLSNAETPDQFVISSAPIKIQYTKEGDEFVPDGKAGEVKQGTYGHVLDIDRKTSPQVMILVNWKSFDDPYWIRSYQRKDQARWVPKDLVNVLERKPQLEAPIHAPSTTTTTAGAGYPTPKPKPPVGHFELKPREAMVIPPDKSEIVKGDQLLVDTHAPEGALTIEVGKQKTRAKHGKTVVKVEDPGNIVFENTSTNRIRVTFYLYKDGEALPPDLEGPDNPLVRFVVKNQMRNPIEVYWKDPSGIEHIYAQVSPGGMCVGKSWTHNTWVVRDSTDGALIDRIERPQRPFDKTYN